MTDTELIDAIEAVMADAITVTFSRRWLASRYPGERRVGGWTVTYNAQFDDLNGKQGQLTARGGGYGLRDAMEQAFNDDEVRRINVVTEALKR